MCLYRGGPPNDSAIFWFSQDFGRGEQNHLDGATLCRSYCLTLVHFTYMSTEHPYEPGTPQYEWLQQDLAAADANRENVPWIVLTGTNVDLPVAICRLILCKLQATARCTAAIRRSKTSTGPALFSRPLSNR